MARRWIVVLAVGVVLMHGSAACVGDTELNPQPLPPRDPASRESSGEKDKGSGTGDNAGSSSSSGGSGGSPNADGDASSEDAGGTDAGGDR